MHKQDECLAAKEELPKLLNDLHELNSLACWYGKEMSKFYRATMAEACPHPFHEISPAIAETIKNYKWALERAQELASKINSKMITIQAWSILSNGKIQ